MRRGFTMVAAAGVLAWPASALAQGGLENAAGDMAPAGDTVRYILDSALLVMGGVGALVALAGLCMREAGLARPQHTPAACLRVLAGFGVAALAFWLVGYNLIYTVEEGGLLGEFRPWTPLDAAAPAAASGVAATARAPAAAWFFQASLAGLAVAAVSGAVSERARLWPFLVFSALLAGLVYPVAAGWTRGQGYFAETWGFYDFGGAVLHIAGGAAALAGAIVVGPRPGRYAGGVVRPAAKTALSLSALGALLFVPGWTLALIAMNGSVSSAPAANTVALIAANACLAAGGGVVTALVITKAVYRRAGVVSSIAGAVGGLVAIAADPAHPAAWQAAMIGGVGGMIVTIAPPFLDRFRIDDAGFCIAPHLLCGLWGAAIAPWSNPDIRVLGQFVGLAAVAAFVFFMSLLLWTSLKYFAGVRSTSADDAAPAPAPSEANA